MRRLPALMFTSLLVAGCGSDQQSAAEQTSTTPPAAAQASTQTAPQPPATTATEEPAQQVPAIPRRDTTAQPPDPELFFFFPDEPNARAAAGDLERHGYRVRTTPPDGEIRDWSVIAEGTPESADLKTAEEAFRPWAEARDGTYDGNEIPLGP